MLYGMGKWIWQEGACGEASCSKREGHVCFALLFTLQLNFWGSSICQNNLFWIKNKTHNKRQWSGVLAGHLPKSTMLLSQKNVVCSLTKKISSWDVTAGVCLFFFSFGVLVFFCLVYSHSNSSLLMTRVVHLQYCKALRPPTH